VDDISSSSSQPALPLPPDDPQRKLAIARPNEDETLPHVAAAGDTYTILLTGEDTAGRFTLIDGNIPPGGGPPPHRHDFEETFTVLEGEVEFSFRGAKFLARAGETLNIPANAPHSFRNASERPARFLCVCAPAGLEALFLAVGDRVASRTAPPPELDETAKAARWARAVALAPQYRTEFLPP
jgi:quercetin dioxygenase-like cupin family protein